MMIPNSKWQRSQQSVERQRFKPGAGERHVAIGLLLEVWDREKLALTDPPEDLLTRIQLSPGILFGLVQVGQTQMYLGFNDTEDLVYLVYGNHSQLEGRKVRIEYENTSIENGRIFLHKVIEQPHLNLDTDLKILDIGGII
jgi:hypothetical protein